MWNSEQCFVSGQYFLLNHSCMPYSRYVKCCQEYVAVTSLSLHIKWVYTEPCPNWFARFTLSMHLLINFHDFTNKGEYIVKQVRYERKDGHDCPAVLRLPVHHLLTTDTGLICLLWGTVKDQTSIPNTWWTDIHPPSYNSCNTKSKTLPTVYWVKITPSCVFMKDCAQTCKKSKIVPRCVLSHELCPFMYKDFCHLCLYIWKCVLSKQCMSSYVLGQRPLTSMPPLSPGSVYKAFRFHAGLIFIGMPTVCVE